MSWLIEAYLEEGKHGPDHPESLNLKTADDHTEKKLQKKGNFFEPDDEMKRADERRLNKLSAAHKILKSDHEKYKNNTLERGSASEQRLRSAAEKDEKKLNKFAKKHGMDPDDGYEVERARDAAERHNRRHPESKVSMESTGMIVESLQ